MVQVCILPHTKFSLTSHIILAQYQALENHGVSKGFGDVIVSFMLPSQLSILLIKLLPSRDYHIVNYILVAMLIEPNSCLLDKSNFQTILDRGLDLS